MQIEHEPRTRVIHVRVSPGENKLIKRAAAGQHDYAANYIRRIVLTAADRDSLTAAPGETEVENGN